MERRIGEFFDAMPRTKRLAKYGYQATNYLLFGERGFRYSLADGVCPVAQIHPAGEEGVFGYYDKTPWSPSSQEILIHGIRNYGMGVYRGDALGSNLRLIGVSSACSWQQGTMLQWAADNRNVYIVYNAVSEGVLGSKWVNTSGEDASEEFVPWPVQTIHPNAGEFIALNYLRLARLRPEYGYDVRVSNFTSERPDEDDGLWLVDRSTGCGKLIVSLRKLSTVDASSDMRRAAHKVNHAIYNPSGTRVVFMHRWIGKSGTRSRLYVIQPHTCNITMLMDSGMVSHYAWINDDSVIVYARTPENGDGYYAVDVRTGGRRLVAPGDLDRYGDGHPSISPSGRFLVTDSYPDRRRQQHLLLHDLRDGGTQEIGRFLLPLRFYGIKRVDLHPRWSRCGNLIAFDTGCRGKRAMMIVDVREVADGNR